MRKPQLIKEAEYLELPLHQSKEYYPVFKKRPLDSIFNHLTYFCGQHKRAFFVRYDLRYPHGYDIPTNNTKLSLFLNNVGEYLSNINCAYVHMWNREVGLVNQRVHHHAVLLLDGNKINSVNSVFAILRCEWAKALGVEYKDSKGLVDYCKKRTEGQMHNGITLSRYPGQIQYFNENFKYAYKWASYLCKEIEGYNPHAPGTRSFGSSPMSKYQGVTPIRFPLSI